MASHIRKSMGGGWILRMFEVGIAMKAQRGADNVFDLFLGNPVVERRLVRCYENGPLSLDGRGLG